MISAPAPIGLLTIALTLLSANELFCAQAHGHATVDDDPLDMNSDVEGSTDEIFSEKLDMDDEGEFFKDEPAIRTEAPKSNSRPVPEGVPPGAIMFEICTS